MKEVYHEPQQKRFVICDGSLESVLEYQFPEAQKVDFIRTFVPVELRDKGYAQKLVAAGLAWAREQGLEITASCWYVEKFLH